MHPQLCRAWEDAMRRAPPPHHMYAAQQEQHSRLLRQRAIQHKAAAAAQGNTSPPERGGVPRPALLHHQQHYAGSTASHSGLPVGGGGCGVVGGSGQRIKKLQQVSVRSSRSDWLQSIKPRPLQDLLASRLPPLPDLSETITVAQQMSRHGSLSVRTMPRARKAGFLERCPVALLIKKSLAERQLEKLPKQQRTTALPLESTVHICSGCSKPAVTAMEFSLARFHGIPEPHPETR